MKNLRWGHIIYYAILPLLSVCLISASDAYQGNKVCTKIEVEIAYNGDNNMFLDMGSVRNLVGANTQILGARLSELQLNETERLLWQTRYAKDVNVWIDGEGAMRIKLWVKQPVVRVCANDGNSYYIDEDFQKIPVSDNFTARAPLLRGDFTQEYFESDEIQDSLVRRLRPLVEFIEENEFWRAMISEIVVKNEHDLRLFTNIGDLEIEFGGVEGKPVEARFATLYKFFEEVCPRTGWNYYKKLSLRYDGQIVATKRR